MYLVLLLANCLLWLGYCAYFLTRPYVSVYHPAIFYLFFHGLVFVIRPIYVYAINYTDLYYAYEFMPSASDKMTVLLGVMLALVVMMQVMLFVAHEQVRPTGGLVKEIEREQLIKPFAIVALLCLPIALYSLNMRFDAKVSGISDMVRDAATGIAINTTSSGYLKDSHFMLVPLCALFAWLMRFRLWSLLPFIVYVLICASTGSRWPFVIGSASLMLLFLWDKRRLMPSPLIMGAGFVLMVLFALVGQDRGSNLRAILSGQQGAGFSSGGAGGTLAGMDFAGLEYFEYLVYAIPQRTDTFGYFLNNLQILTEPIPRILWSGKPIGPPVQLYNLFDYGYPIGMSNTLPGEGWAQLGWLGIILWCAFWGWLLGRFYLRFARNTQSNFTPLYYLLIIPHTLTFFRDGMVLTFLKTSFFFLIPLVLLQLIARGIIPSLGEIGHGLTQRHRSRARVSEETDDGADGSQAKLTPRRRRQALARRWHG